MIRKKETLLANQSGNQCILAVRAIVSSVETLLGPNQSLKYCTSDDITVTTSSTCKVIEHLEIEHPVGFIINDVCQNFKKQFGCGCTTLICLIGYWAKHLQKVVEMGVPVTVIGTIVDQSIQEFYEVFKRSSISVKPSCKSNFDEKTQNFEKNMARSISSSIKQQKETLDFKGKPKMERTGKVISEWSENDDDDVAWFFEPPKNCDKTEHIDNINSNHRKNDNSKNKEEQNQKKSITSQHLSQNLPEISDMLGSGACFGNDMKTKNHLTKDLTTSILSPSATRIRLGPVNSSKPNVRILSRHFVGDEKTLPSTNHNLPCTVKYVNNQNDNQELSRNTNTDITHFPEANKSRGSLDITEKTSSPSHRDENNVSSGNTNSKQYRHSDGGINFNEPALTDGNINVVLSRNELIALNYEASDKYVGSNLEIFITNARALAHGKENEMAFVVEIIKKQNRIFANKICLTSNYIDVQTIVGPHSCNSCALDGVVLEISQENLSVLQKNDVSRRVMLISGDITNKYNHTGFKTPVELTRIVTKDMFKEAYPSERDEWITKIESIVRELNVGVVVSRGIVDKDLGNLLQNSDVVVLKDIRPKQLKMFSKMTNTPIITYPTDMEVHDLGKPVVFKSILSGLSLREHFNGNLKHGDQSKTFVQISLHHDDRKTTTSVVHTLVLCGQVSHVVIDSEMKFWNCISRVQNALDDGQVLPGNGEIEQRCIEHLEKLRDSHGENDITEKQIIFPWLAEDCVMFRPLVYDALISGLKDLFQAGNKITQNDQCTTFDNYICKIEGWKRALRVVKILLNSEYQITTGIDKI